MVIILGAGIAGISAGYHLEKRGIDSVIYEKRASWGGLCDNFKVGDFRFDYFVHLSFTNDDYVRQLLAESADFTAHTPASDNYYKGLWLKHPAQNNLAALSSNEKVNIIVDFVNKPDASQIRNYRDWLRAQFGIYFSENFPEKYTLKYWTLAAEKMGTDWLPGRFSLPNLCDLLKGAFEEQEQNFYYAQEMRYPKVGGFKSFLSKMATGANIKADKEVCSIDLKTKRIEFKDGSSANYERLVSSLPLPVLVKSIKDAPRDIVEAAEKLSYTSGQLVSLGFNRPHIKDNIWFYVYDRDILPSRAYSPSNKSPENTPAGKSSLQFETYFSRHLDKVITGDEMIDHIVKKGSEMGLFTPNDIEVADYREVEYANIIFDFDRKSNLEKVHAYLDANGIKYIGRFGEWDYLWTDQSILSGKKIADELVKYDNGNN